MLVDTSMYGSSFNANYSGLGLVESSYKTFVSLLIQFLNLLSHATQLKKVTAKVLARALLILTFGTSVFRFLLHKTSKLI